MPNRVILLRISVRLVGSACALADAQNRSLFVRSTGDWSLWHLSLQQCHDDCPKQAYHKFGSAPRDSLRSRSSRLSWGKETTNTMRNKYIGVLENRYLCLWRPWRFSFFTQPIPPGRAGVLKLDNAFFFFFFCWFVFRWWLTLYRVRILYDMRVLSPHDCEAIVSVPNSTSYFNLQALKGLRYCA